MLGPPQSVVGAATGTAGFVRMLGAAAGTGALGSLFTHAVARRLPSGVDASSLTPAAVAGMPDGVRHAVQVAVAAGSSSLFWVTAAIAVVAVVAALALPRRAAPSPLSPADTAATAGDSVMTDR